MSAIDNLTLDGYTKILKRYKKDKNVDISYLIADRMETPNSCCLRFFVCCCCCVGITIKQAKIKRSMAIEKFLFHYYPNKSTDDMMKMLEDALDVIKRNGISLNAVRNMYPHLRRKYPILTDEDHNTIHNALALLNPEVSVL